MQINHLHIRGLHSLPPKRRPQLHPHHHRWKLNLLPRWCGNTHGLPRVLQTHHQKCSITKGSTICHIWYQKCLPRHLHQPTQICQNMVNRHSQRIHRGVWPGDRNTRGMDLLLNPQSSLWFNPDRETSKWYDMQMTRHHWLLWSSHHPRPLATQVVPHPIFTHSWWFWHWLCGGMTH